MSWKEMVGVLANKAAALTESILQMQVRIEAHEKQTQYMVGELQKYIDRIEMLEKNFEAKIEERMREIERRTNIVEATVTSTLQQAAMAATEKGVRDAMLRKLGQEQSPITLDRKLGPKEDDSAPPG